MPPTRCSARSRTRRCGLRLVAVPDGDGGLRFDIRLQGAQETPFLAI